MSSSSSNLLSSKDGEKPSKKLIDEQKDKHMKISIEDKNNKINV